MRDSVKKIVISGGVVLAAGTWLLIKSLNQVDDFRDKYEGYDLNADVEGTVREGTYTRYQNAHADAPYPEKDVEVSLPDYVSGENVEVYSAYEGVDKALYTGEGSSVTWEVEIPESGLYNVCLDYMTVESRGVAIERALYINGELMMRPTWLSPGCGWTGARSGWITRAMRSAPPRLRPMTGSALTAGTIWVISPNLMNSIWKRAKMRLPLRP